MIISLLTRRSVSVAGGLLVLCSCGRFGHDKPASAMPKEQAAASASSTEDQEAKLRRVVADVIRSAAGSEDAAHAKLVSKEPYYFKEYTVYPEGAEGYTVEIQEKESRTAPYAAVVKMRMLRYATRMHRKRDQAQADGNFLRDTGAQTISYELRNGKWWRAGSLFVADKTEEYVSGEWVPVREEVQRTGAAEEENANWFNRTWSAITGK
jgi:hypothetical protein